MDPRTNQRAKPHYPQDTSITPSRVSQEQMLAPDSPRQEAYGDEPPPDTTQHHRPVQLEETYVSIPPTRPVIAEQTFSYDNGGQEPVRNQSYGNQPPTPHYGYSQGTNVDGGPSFVEQPPAGTSNGSVELKKKSRLDPITKKINKKWQKRLYWIIPLSILAIILTVLFEVYKDDFENWVQPLADWLTKNDSWSWVIPVAILFILSFPPLFGHEIVLLIVGLAWPLGIALGIACAGAVLGEAGCFVLFKYMFSGWVQKKIDTKVNWAATARVSQEAGFRGVLVIRYSIVPPHLANPLFACTGMKFWLYMATVILSLPKNMVFVALGTPSSENSKGAKYAKVVAILVVLAITVFASAWIRKKMAIATKEIERERGILSEEGGEEQELDTFNGPTKSGRVMGNGDTTYHGYSGSNGGTEYQGYQGGPSGYQGVPNPAVNRYEEQDLGAAGQQYRNHAM